MKITFFMKNEYVRIKESRKIVDNVNQIKNKFDVLTNNNTKRGASRLINNSLWLLCDECESFSSLSIG